MSFRTSLRHECYISVQAKTVPLQVNADPLQVKKVPIQAKLVPIQAKLLPMQAIKYSPNTAKHSCAIQPIYNFLLCYKFFICLCEYLIRISFHLDYVTVKSVLNSRHCS